MVRANACARASKHMIIKYLVRLVNGGVCQFVLNSYQEVGKK